MSEQFRTDFIQRIESLDPKTGEGTISLEPDPRRYIKLEDDTGIFYIDKYLKVRFSLDDLFRHFQGSVPIYALAPSVKSVRQYAQSRTKALNHEFLSGKYTAPKEAAKRQPSLIETNKSTDLGFLSLDICGSTTLRRIDPVAFDKAFGVLIRELGSLVGHFNGSILKTTGDGFVAYIDHPSYTNLCDSLVELGLSCLNLMKCSINPALKKHGLPEFNVRIGANHGSAVVRKVAIPTTGFSSIDIYSDAFNRAKKIEESCDQNEFRIGFDLYKLIHVQWLERCVEVTSLEAGSLCEKDRVFIVS
ncbi:adenylate/guanylate cyclase domain-containing protein [Thioclava sp. GXIMD4215]|uniref:adenylate/guanylate cyclase domain-containing protein n=1 Tax=Thioclava sp. GXIMD4215 TaxID=3131928 RepID=UPI0032480226